MMKIVKLKVKDLAFYHNEKHYMTGFDYSVMEIVGFLVEEDKDKIVLAHQWFEDSQEVRHTTVIPKECIMETYPIPNVKEAK